MRFHVCIHSRLERNTTAIACDKVRLYKAKQVRLQNEVETLESTLFDQNREREILRSRLADLELQKQEELKNLEKLLNESKLKYESILSEYNNTILEISQRLSFVTSPFV